METKESKVCSKVVKREDIVMKQPKERNNIRVHRQSQNNINGKSVGKGE